jgi:mRNA-degrading endonuclease RelE of RelBE toxin-antitoxin system
VHCAYCPREIARINRALNDMKADPLSGDVALLRGEYRGLYRRRVGPWRIIFGLRPDRRVVIVADIVRRTSTTY